MQTYTAVAVLGTFFPGKKYPRDKICLPGDKEGGGRDFPLPQPQR